MRNIPIVARTEKKFQVKIYFKQSKTTFEKKIRALRAIGPKIN